jgi:hypothetical protein
MIMGLDVEVVPNASPLQPVNRYLVPGGEVTEEGVTLA